jgi:hypothetical protein
VIVVGKEAEEMAAWEESQKWKECKVRAATKCAEKFNIQVV